MGEVVKPDLAEIIVTLPGGGCASAVQSRFNSACR